MSSPVPPAPSSASRAEALALGVALIAAAIPRFVGIGWSLPSLFEEATPFRVAWVMWGFAPLHHFDLNPHWFTYPSLIFYLQMAGQALTFGLLRLFGGADSLLDLRVRFFTDPTPYVLVARSITACFGVATVWPVWAIARREAGARAAFLAAMIVALHPELIAKSQVIEVDVPLACLMAFALDRTLGAIERPRLRSWLVAGVLAGLATGTKYPGLVLAAPLAVAAWASRKTGAPPVPAPREAERGAGPPRGARREASKRRDRARDPRLLRAARRLAVALLALGVTFFLTSPFVILDFASAAQDAAEGRDLMTIEHFGVAAGAAYATYAHDWFAKLMGWPLGIASLAAILVFALRGRAWALLLAAVFLPFIGVVGSWQMKADRYLIPLLPLAAVAGAIGLAQLSARLLKHSARGRAIAFAAMGVVALGPIVARLPAQRATLGTDTRTQARRWIEQNVAPGSLIATEIYGPDLISPVGMQQYDADVRREIAKAGGRTRVYAVQTVPMYVLRPERSAKYYDLERLGEIDALVVSSAVRERYRGEPGRYAAQLHFYERLERSWPCVARFSPHGGAGPDLAIYRNPQARIPFASRPSVPPADTTLATTGEMSGSEGFWYFNLGINHELAHHYPAARECYLLALRFGATEPDTYANVALRLASLLRDEGRPGSAIALLEMCADRAPGPVQAEVLRAGIATMRAGGEISAPVGR